MTEDLDDAVGVGERQMATIEADTRDRIPIPSRKLPNTWETSYV